MRKYAAIPSTVSAVRIAALPLLLFLMSQNSLLSLPFFLFLCATDLADGYLARRLGVACKMGTFFDSAADFALIMGSFALFYAHGLYPAWVLILILFSYAQFVLTSLHRVQIIDPVGKYFGSFLYIAIAATLLFPIGTTFEVVEVAFVAFAAASFSSRILFFARFHRNKTPITESVGKTVREE